MSILTVQRRLQTSLHLNFQNIKTITIIVNRYLEQDTWKNDTIFTKESFDLLQDILLDAGELEQKVPYDDLVTTTYAKNAVTKFE